MKTYTRIDAGTGRVYPLDDSDWPDNNRGGETNMSGIYSPPLLAEDLDEIVLALGDRARLVHDVSAKAGDEKAKRMARYARALATRLQRTKPNLQ